MKKHLKKWAIFTSSALLTLQLFTSQAQATASYALFGEEIVYNAKKFLGVPYVWGGESPRGFDCSGLVTYTFREFGVALPHRADLQYNFGDSVNQEQLEPGDLVFFRSGRGGWIGHVGIYIGEDRFIHAPRRGKPVKIDTLSAGWYQARYIGAKRILPDEDF